MAGDGASRPERRLVDVAALRLGLTPVNLGVGGSSSAQTAELVGRHGAAAAEAYLIMAGLNDARLRGEDPAALEAYAQALTVVVGACAARSPGSLVLLVRQPPLVDYSRHAPHDRGSSTSVEAYNVVLEKVAARYPGGVVVTVPSWDPTSMLAGDTVHPNELGHATIGLAVADAYVSASMGSTSPLHD